MTERIDGLSPNEKKKYVENLKLLKAGFSLDEIEKLNHKERLGYLEVLEEEELTRVDREVELKASSIFEYDSSAVLGLETMLREKGVGFGIEDTKVLRDGIAGCEEYFQRQLKAKFTSFEDAKKWLKSGGSEYAEHFEELESYLENFLDEYKPKFFDLLDKIDQTNLFEKLGDHDAQTAYIALDGVYHAIQKIVQEPTRRFALHDKNTGDRFELLATLENRILTYAKYLPEKTRVELLKRRQQPIVVQQPVTDTGYHQ